MRFLRKDATRPPPLYLCRHSDIDVAVLIMSVEHFTLVIVATENIATPSTLPRRPAPTPRTSRRFAPTFRRAEPMSFCRQPRFLFFFASRFAEKPLRYRRCVSTVTARGAIYEQPLIRHDTEPPLCHFMLCRAAMPYRPLSPSFEDTMPHTPSMVVHDSSDEISPYHHVFHAPSALTFVTHALAHASVMRLRLPICHFTTF